MSRRTVKLPSTPATASLITILNREFQLLHDAIDNLRQNPQLYGDLDLQGHRIKNVGASVKNSDVPTRAELIDMAMYKNASGQHVAKSSVVATSGIRSTRKAREADELVPLRQVQELIGATAPPSGTALVTEDVDQFALGLKTFSGLSLFLFTYTASTTKIIPHIIDSPPHYCSGFGLEKIPALTSIQFVGLGREESPPTNGRVILVINQTGIDNVTIYPSTAPEVSAVPDILRIRTPGGATVNVRQNATVMFVYRAGSGSNKWYIVSRP